MKHGEEYGQHRARENSMTSDERNGRFGLHGGDGPTGSEHDLAVLDPGLDDPGYWSRFVSLVMVRAADELSGRRVAAEVGVADFLQSWSVTVIRAALIAAAIAGVLLLRDGPATALGIEEALTMGLEDQTLPDLMEQPEGGDSFLLVEVTF
jgi:hypothetical protein